MYITNNPKVAKIAEEAGVDRIFVDMEYIGKAKRQGGMDTVQSHHTVEDIKRIRGVLHKAELIVRVNPIHEASEEYCSSETEINDVIEAVADIIMLPYFKTLEEVTCFLKIINKRTRTMLLVETPEAVDIIDDILNLEGIDEIHIGLNDLHLGYKKKFMFELLSDGTVDMLCEKFKRAGLNYGFGGISRVGTGTLPAEYIIKEHYRLGSTIAILSRSFCNTSIITDREEIEKIFNIGVKEIRKVEKECSNYTVEKFDENRKIVIEKIKEIVN